MEFRILNFDEGVFDINKDFILPKEKEITISVNIRPVFRYAIGSDVVVCQLTLKYQHEDIIILTYGFAVAVAVKDWCEFIKESPEKDEIVKYIFEVWNASVNAGRGVLMEKTKGTELSKFIIPDIPIDKLIQILRLEQSEKK